MNIALCGGPWIIAGQTLVVQQWRPEFNPYVDKISRMAVWVRILGLPFHLFKEFTATKIGKTLGNVVKIDKLTLAQTRGKFARICVEIDLQKPLIPYVEVEDFSYGVVYEGISMICFNCGCYGHVKSACPHQTTDGNPPEPELMAARDVNPTIEIPRSGVANITDSAMDATVSSSKVDDSINTPLRPSSGGPGPWMLMTYKSRKHSTVQPGNVKASSGSRFSVLTLDDVDSTVDIKQTEVVTISDDNDNGKETTEPKIVKIWKQVQKKINHREGTSSSSANTLTSPDPMNISTPKTTKEPNKPLKDITNENLALVQDNTKSPTIPKIARNASLGKGVTIKQVRKINKSRKAPINLTIPCPNLDSLESNPNPHPISTNIPATFGHCPPENATSISADEIPVFKIPAPNIDQDKPSSTIGELEEVSFYDTLDQNLASSTDNLLALSNSSPSNEEDMITG